MATITKRGSTYLVRWYRLDGSRDSRTCPTKQAALDLRREVDHERALGRDWSPRVPREVPSLADAADAYLKDRATTRRPATLVALGYLLDYATRFVAERTKTSDPLVSALSRGLVVDYYASMPHLSEGSRHNRVGALLDLWRWLDAHEEYDGLVPRYRPVELRPVERTDTIAPTWAECDAVIADLLERLDKSKSPDTRGRALRCALVLRYAGLRIGQVIGLRWDDVDLDRATIRVRGELGKSRQERRGRVVPVTPHLVEALKGWGTRTGPVCGSRFVQSMRRMIRESTDRCIEAGTVRTEAFAGQGTHAFRKAFVSELRRAGAENDAVEYLVGHSMRLRAHYVDPDALGLRNTVALVAKVGDRITTGSPVATLRRKDP